MMQEQLDWLQTEKLNVGQEVALARRRDAYLSHGLSSTPADRPAAEAACAEVYRRAGLPPPETIVWFDNPSAGTLATAYLMSDRSRFAVDTGEDLITTLYTDMRERLAGQIWSEANLDVWEQVGEDFWDPIREQTDSPVLAAITRQIIMDVEEEYGDPSDAYWSWKQNIAGRKTGDVHTRFECFRADLLSKARAKFIGEVKRQVNRAGYGQFDAYWAGAYKFMSETFGLADDIAGIDGLVKSCGLWWPFERLAILTERPCFLTFDDQNRLHNEHRAALEYPDGWGIYAWHGIHVPKLVICRPGDISFQIINAELDIEVRRVMIERMGYERYIRDGGGELISEDLDIYGRSRRLWNCQFNEVMEPLRLVEVLNATPEPDGSTKTYFLPVPQFDERMDEILVPAHAVAWTFSMTPEEYKTLIET